MSYTILESGRPGWSPLPGDTVSPIRLIGFGRDGTLRVAKACRPLHWECHPCRLSSRRYTVTFDHDGAYECEYAWWQVVTADDDHRTRVAKLRRAQAVDAAQEAVRLAQVRLLSLTR